MRESTLTSRLPISPGSLCIVKDYHRQGARKAKDVKILMNEPPPDKDGADRERSVLLVALYPWG